MATVPILPTTHALDETGTLPENYIENERRDLAQRDIRAFPTRFGAFFVDTFVLRDANGVVIPRTKYQFALFNDIISAKTGKTICSAVLVLDKTIPSPVYADYHCVGGPWGVSNEHILELFNQLQTDDRPVSWPNIIGLPDGFTPAHHLQDIGDLYGAEYWVAAIERLSQAFLMGDNASHDEIFRRIQQVYNELMDEITGLNESIRAYVDQQDGILRNEITTVDERVTAVREEMLNAIAVVDQRITTVAATLQTNINAVQSQLNSHVANKTNPHQVTAAQAGAYTIGQVDSLIAGINNSLNNYVKKNVGEDLALTNSGGNLYVYLNGQYRIVWPPQWQ